jgi:NAD-dependent SIR2 family protein deacetylase
MVRDGSRNTPHRIGYNGWVSSTSDLAALLRDLRWVALTGAGLSTDSGLPDYRGPDARPTKPLLFDEFTGSAAHRRRYWARAMVAWGTFAAVHPNPGHAALARLSAHGLTGIITQNVDGLHQSAGSRNVLELHGTLFHVRCLDCDLLVHRHVVQDALEQANPGWRDRLPSPPDSGDYATPERLRPDGDAEVDDWRWLRLVECGACGGMLKPDVVFFGESVPKQRVRAGYELVDGAEALVVAGSSLTVMSGLRFVRHAAKDGKPIAIINRGPTRGDDVATLKIEAGTSESLDALAAALA